MRGKQLVSGAVLGGLSAIPVILVLYLGERLADLLFLPFALFDWLARVLPGGLVTTGIDLIVGLVSFTNPESLSTAAKLVEQLLALLMFAALGLVVGILLATVLRHTPARLTSAGVWTGLGLLIISLPALFRSGRPAAALLTNILWLAVVYAAWGVGLARLLWKLSMAEGAVVNRADRRRFLYTVGASLLAGVAALLGLGIVFRRLEVSAADQQTTSPLPTPTPDKRLAGRIEPVPGTRPELTSNADFYRIDIDTRPPQVDGAAWRLRIEGLVDNPLSLSLDDLRRRPAVSQYITLSCISNRLGGDLISTSRWTGVPLKAVLAEANPQPTVQEAFIEAVDGFYESVSMADMEDERTLLVYEMNSQPLPAAHGFPLRIYIPNRYGMKQPKWIERIELIDHEGNGYWVDRGWSKRAIPHTTSVIDNVLARGIAEQVLIGGIAYAGARGISRVEVQVDDGPWTAASLRIPPLSQLTWVQWRYEVSLSQPGRHVARVRAYDGSGALQSVETTGVQPDGATGVYVYPFKVPA